MSDYWRRVTQQRISRRRVLGVAGAGLAAAASMAVAGCKRSSTATSNAQPTLESTNTGGDQPDVLNPGGAPRRGGILNVSEAANFGTFDPHLGIALASAYFPRLYNVLVNQSAAKPEFSYFDLASSLHQPDDQTFVFKIRPGVKIAPNDLGVPERDLDAEDVRLNIERIRSTPAANSHAFMREYVASVTATADTVTIKTARPYAWFLNRIGLFISTIAPRELLAGNLDRLTAKAAGAGPFRLTSVQEGERATFARNPNYYRKDDATGDPLPYVDGIDLSVVLDKATARTKFLDGQVHRYTPSSAAEADDLAREYTIQRDANYSFIAFTMNFAEPPFDDARVRLAFSRAIDRSAFVDLVYDGQARPNGLVHWSLGAYALDPTELNQTYQPYDIADARRLVEAVGGIKVKMMYPQSALEEHDSHLPIFLRQMKDAGIEIEQDLQQLTTWIDNYRNLNYQCSLALNQFYETPEIPLGFHTTAGPLGDGTYVRGMGDPEIETAVTRSRETLAYDDRVKAVHDAQKVIYGKTPGFLPLVTPFTYQAYQKSVHDIPAGVGTTAFLLNTFWLDS